MFNVEYVIPADYVVLSQSIHGTILINNAHIRHYYNHNNNHNDDDAELMVLSSLGGHVKQCIRCECVPIMSRFVYFHDSDENNVDNNKKDTKTIDKYANAIAILVHSLLLRIVNMNGISTDIQLEQPCCDFIALPRGLLLIGQDKTTNKTMFYSLLGILCPVKTITIMDEQCIGVDHRQRMSMSPTMDMITGPTWLSGNRGKYRIIASHREYLVLFDQESGILTLFIVQYSTENSVLERKVSVQSRQSSPSSMQHSSPAFQSIEFQQQADADKFSHLAVGASVRSASPRGASPSAFNIGINLSQSGSSTNLKYFADSSLRLSPSPTSFSSLDRQQRRERDRSREDLRSSRRSSRSSASSQSFQSPNAMFSPDASKSRLSSSAGPIATVVDEDVCLQKLCQVDDFVILFESITEREFDLEASFSGSIGDVGGLWLHVRHASSTKYACYRVHVANESLSAPRGSLQIKMRNNEEIVPSLRHVYGTAHSVAHVSMPIGRLVKDHDPMRPALSCNLSLVMPTSNCQHIVVYIGSIPVHKELMLFDMEYDCDFKQPGMVQDDIITSIEPIIAGSNHHFLCRQASQKQIVLSALHSILLECQCASVIEYLIIALSSIEKDVGNSVVELILVVLYLIQRLGVGESALLILMGIVMGGSSAFADVGFKLNEAVNSISSETICFFAEKLREECRNCQADRLLFDVLSVIRDDLALSHNVYLRSQVDSVISRLCPLESPLRICQVADWYSTCVRNTDKSFRSSGQSLAVPVPSYFSSTSLSLLDKRIQWIVSPCISAVFSIFFHLVTDSTNSTHASETNLTTWSVALTNSIVASLAEYRSLFGYSEHQTDASLFLQRFPQALQSLILIALSLNRRSDAITVKLPRSLLLLIGRKDLVETARSALESMSSSRNALASKSNGKIVRREASRTQKPIDRGNATSQPDETSDGLDIIESMSEVRFADDDRVHEACRLLRASRSLYLRVEKAPETSDLEHREKLLNRLTILCRRSLATCVGRGMMTMGTLSLLPLLADVLPIPPIAMSGRLPPSNSTIVLDAQQISTDLLIWPTFHNGVAAGLRIGVSPTLASFRYKLEDGIVDPTNYAAQPGKDLATITRNWIVYNRSTAFSNNQEVQHAGLLLALGLQGHLGVISAPDVSNYLTQGVEVLTVAILMGIGASKIGSADPFVSKTLCLHLPALLPVTHSELEISSTVQAAALTGIGLLYCKSGNRLMTELLLGELTKTSSTYKYDNREALSLATAWALGMVLLGRGSAISSATEPSKGQLGIDSASDDSGLIGLADLQIEDRLQKLIDGGPRENAMTQSNGDYMSKTSKVLEGSRINSDVTCIGSIIALSLIYLKSNSMKVAERLALPQTSYLLDRIRPDYMLFRTLGRCLILWDSVKPSDAWIESLIPKLVRDTVYAGPLAPRTTSLTSSIALQLFLCTTAGACLGVGLVYAGTGDEAAKKVLLGKLLLLQRFRDNKADERFKVQVEKSTRPTLEMCISTCALALSCVLAGTGDVDALRVLRELRWKVDDVTYGTHMALSMAIALLFLSGGSASLRRDSVSIACLLIALIPRYPMKAPDNQYHLQAWRHFTALATESRCLQSIDADSQEPVSLAVCIQMRDGSTRWERTPCLLPELFTVKSVEFPGSISIPSEGTDSPIEYYPTLFEVPTLSRLLTVPSIFVSRIKEDSKLSNDCSNYGASNDAISSIIESSTIYVSIRLEALKQGV